MDSIKQKLQDLPQQPGVYLMHAESGQILYVGKARNLKKRVNQYFANTSNKTEKTVRLVAKIADFEYIITRNEIEALVLENNLIKKHQPPYNILLKDDKSYPFVKINVKEDFPRVEVVRKLRSDGAKYFGPYMLGIGAKDILDLLHSAFPLRTCRLDMNKVPKGHRACLNYHIKRCCAPCIGAVTREEYAQIIGHVVAFLNGNDKKVGSLLTEKMKTAAEREDFELALFYRQKLETLEKLVRKQVTALPKDLDLDIFAIAENGFNRVVSALFVRGGKLVGGDKRVVTDLVPDAGVALSNYILQYYDTIGYIAGEIVTSREIEDADVISEYLTQKKGSKVNVIAPHQGVRKQLADMADSNAADYLEKSIAVQERKENMTMGGVVQLQEFLRLRNLPVRMECYDISHVQGTDKVASMVVFLNGEPCKAHYRKFKIRTVAGNDDFASLKETLSRRLDKLGDAQCTDESFSARPDLIVIDGGKGQLSGVMEIARSRDVSQIQFISLAKREEEVFMPGESQPRVLPRNSYALKLLQRIRDEAHRFAITFHRAQRSIRQTHSKLLEIEGVGSVRAKELLTTFKTMENLKNASQEDLCLAKGMDRRAAYNVWSYFHPQPNSSRQDPNNGSDERP